MALLLRFFFWIAVFASSMWGQTPVRFRIWMVGQEVGAREITSLQEGEQRTLMTHEWSRLERLGMSLDMDIQQRAIKAPDGTLRFTWRVKMSQQPMEGEAFWSPNLPTRLEVRPKEGEARTVDLAPGTLLWPEEQEHLLKEAARTRTAVHLVSYNFPLNQPSDLNLQAVGPDPLPGFPDAVRFRGRNREGAMVMDLDVWISPVHGQLKEEGVLAGISILSQRAELPTPGHMSPEKGLFERTLRPLPHHPFLPWLREATLRWEGQGEQNLPEDPQQKRLESNVYRLRRAELPTVEEAAERPTHGPVSEAEAPFLAATSLLQFKDPVFDGLLVRLRAPADASRWELAQRVTRFVFEWIEEKDYSVGFAPALEVAKRSRGDCTEHGVLAVALLRKLGVPARGVLGWVALDQIMGLHFWVEVKLKDRWVPVDPTFDEAPASALHLKLSTTDLADLGSVGWDNAQVNFTEGRWLPKQGWPQTFSIQGDRLKGPDFIFRVVKGVWSMKQDHLRLRFEQDHGVQAIPRPSSGMLREAKALLDPTSGRRGWWKGPERQLFFSLNETRWLLISEVQSPAQVQRLMEHFQVISSGAKP